MEFILFRNGKFIGIRGSIPTEDEGLEFKENFPGFEAFIVPGLVNNQVVETATPEEIAEFAKAQVPQKVSLASLMFVLAVNELEAPLLSAVDTIPDPQQKLLVQSYLKHGYIVERYSPTTLFMQSKLELTDAQVDAFLAADALQV